MNGVWVGAISSPTVQEWLPLLAGCLGTLQVALNIAVGWLLADASLHL